MPPVDIAGLKQGYADTGAAEVNAGAIGTIAPYASHLSAPVAPVQQFNAAASLSAGSGLSKVAHFIGGIGADVGHLAVGATKWLATNAVSMATALPRTVEGIHRGIQDNTQINWNTQRTQQNSRKLSSLVDSYKTGRISKAEYQSGLQDLIKSNNAITESEKALNSKVNADKTSTYTAMIDTASAVVTLLTAGVGSEVSLLPDAIASKLPGMLGKSVTEVTATKTAADYLASTNANSMLTNVENGLNHFATNPEAFGKLSTGAQMALQRATAEVISTGAASMTSTQIARSAAVNLALKNPFYYNYLSGTGHQLYHELDQQKYGAAVKTLAFNSALMLSGGPIGQALKYGGDAARGLVSRTFDRSTFLDELSKGIGDGSPDGLYNAVQHANLSEFQFFDRGKLVTLTPEEAQGRLVQNLKAVEATNMQATVGKDSVAAAWRVLSGMAAYEGVTMDTFTHEEFLKNMSNFAEAQRAADFYGHLAGLTGVTVGRVDTRDLDNILEALSPTISKDNKASLAAFNKLIAENPTRAWANNENFISQIKGLIGKYNTSAKFEAAVKDIHSQYRIKGFPTAIAKKLSGMGYIPIEPTSLEAPFKEGSAEKMASKFAEDSSFFKQAVQPLPVLSHLGGVLTGMGLTPQSAEGQVYQMYNAAFSERIAGLSSLKSFAKDTPEATGDNVLKTLSDWTKKLNAGELRRGSILGIPVRPPVMDLRQLMAKDTAAALNISASDAKVVNQELRNAMLDVPLAVRGLGDKVVDVFNKTPLFRSYMRAQGAGRFSWNPIFQGKLVAKTEALTQAVSGGKTLVVMENILGHGPQIEQTRTELRAAGMLDKASKFMHDARAGGEGSLEGNAVGANLSHSLLPFQEKSIAGMINKQAAKVGLSSAEFISNFPQETRDTIQMIAQYDRNSALLHSPLMRTLNFAFFPLRFETKVATIMAKSLAQTDTLTQVAVINGLMNAHNWMNSPEGMAWYSKNADVLKFFNYFTPTMTLSTVGELLSGLSSGDYKTLAGSFELGGLPIGWIPQMLSDEGANFTPGYVDPGTGQVVAKQIPNTAKAQLQVALSDLMGSLFTYPGAELGLPSKTSVDRFMAGGIVGGQAKKSEFTPTQPYLDARQQQFAKTISGQVTPTGTTQGATAPTTSTPIPVQGSGTALPKYKNGIPPTKKLKKSQFKAELPA